MLDIEDHSFVQPPDEGIWGNPKLPTVTVAINNNPHIFLT